MSVSPEHTFVGVEFFWEVSPFTSHEWDVAVHGL